MKRIKNLILFAACSLLLCAHSIDGQNSTPTRAGLDAERRRETTAGATMPGMSHRINENFSIWISTGRAESGSAANENKGVAPDLPVAPEKAVTAAPLEILKQFSAPATDENWKTELTKIRTEIEALN